jgi:hypothetical protein
VNRRAARGSEIQSVELGSRNSLRLFLSIFTYYDNETPCLPCPLCSYEQLHGARRPHVSILDASATTTAFGTRRASLALSNQDSRFNTRLDERGRKKANPNH